MFFELWQKHAPVKPTGYKDVEHFPHPRKFPQTPFQSICPPHCPEVTSAVISITIDWFSVVLSFLWMHSYSMYSCICDYFTQSNVCWRTLSCCLYQQIIPFYCWVLLHSMNTGILRRYCGFSSNHCNKVRHMNFLVSQCI